MTRVVGLVALLIIAIAPIVAATNVPDPTWLAGGVYDGGDADEILTLVWDQTPVVATSPLYLQSSISAALELVAPQVCARPLPAASPGSRAPPLG